MGEYGIEKVFAVDEWVNLQMAKVGLFDHGVLYGDGVYEGLRAYDGKIFRCEQHLQRLARSAKCLALELPYTLSDIESILYEGLKRNNLHSAYIRILLTRGVGDIGPSIENCACPSLYVIVKETKPFHGDNASQGIDVALSSVRRVAVDSSTAQIKSLNYLPSVMGKIEARRMAVDDVVMMDSQGHIAEAPVANVFVVRDNVVMTPLKSSGILEGITRQTCIELCATLNYSLVEAQLTPYDLSVADELFLTGTHAEIVPVKSYNGQVVGSGGVGQKTAAIMETYQTLVLD